MEEEIVHVSTPTAAYQNPPLFRGSRGQGGGVKNYVKYFYLRVRQLLVQRRMRGAFKVRNAWRIPLYDGIPEVIRAPIRNRKGMWQTKRKYTKGAMLYVQRQRLAANEGEPYPDPPIIVRRGGKVENYYHESPVNTLTVGCRWQAIAMLAPPTKLSSRWKRWTTNTITQP